MHKYATYTVLRYTNELHESHKAQNVKPRRGSDKYVYFCFKFVFSYSFFIWPRVKYIQIRTEVTVCEPIRTVEPGSILKRDSGFFKTCMECYVHRQVFLKKKKKKKHTHTHTGTPHFQATLYGIKLHQRK